METIDIKIKELVTKIIEKWDYYKSLEEPDKREYSDSTTVKTINGYTAEFDNPNVLWLMIESEDGGYDGSSSQIGLNKNGKFIWEYQSHCSCYGFEDSDNPNGDGELALDYDITKKTYELNHLNEDWKKIIKANLEEILTK